MIIDVLGKIDLNLVVPLNLTGCLEDTHRCLLVLLILLKRAIDVEALIRVDLAANQIVLL